MLLHFDDAAGHLLEAHLWAEESRSWNSNRLLHFHIILITHPVLFLLLQQSCSSVAKTPLVASVSMMKIG